MSIEVLADGIIDLIRKNMIAKTNVTSNVTTGDIIVNIENAYRFHPDEEIVIIDWGYNTSGDVHNNTFEYARIKAVNNTSTITLYDAVQSNWLTSQNSFIQKTIGHSPLYDDNIFYGDREVIPVEDIAITVEPVSLTNEWIYIQGGLSEEYRIRIMIYGKSIETDEGRRILDRYSWAVYSLLNSNIHIDVNDLSTPLLNDFSSGGNKIVIEDTAANRLNYVVNALTDPAPYRLQDNQGATCWFRITNVNISGGLMHLTLSRTIDDDFLLSEFAVLRKIGEYIYDSRVDNVDFGQVSKGSAFLRAAELNWWGKRVNEHTFPQTSDGVDDFVEKVANNSSSSSSSSFGYSSSSSSSSFGYTSSSSSLGQTSSSSSLGESSSSSSLGESSSSSSLGESSSSSSLGESSSSSSLGESSSSSLGESSSSSSYGDSSSSSSYGYSSSSSSLGESSSSSSYGYSSSSSSADESSSSSEGEIIKGFAGTMSEIAVTYT